MHGCYTVHHAFYVSSVTGKTKRPWPPSTMSMSTLSICIRAQGPNLAAPSDRTVPSDGVLSVVWPWSISIPKSDARSDLTGNISPASTVMVALDCAALVPPGLCSPGLCKPKKMKRSITSLRQGLTGQKLAPLVLIPAHWSRCLSFMYSPLPGYGSYAS